jgi:hypothetical protein
LSRDLDVQYKTAFVLAHKVREAMASEMKGATIGGAGRIVEIDGCHVAATSGRRTKRRTALTGGWRGTGRVRAGSWLPCASEAGGP